MARSERTARRLNVVSGSELAEMAVCERRVLLARLHGERRTRVQLAAMQRGLREHDQFHLDGRAASEAANQRLASVVVALVVRALARFRAWLVEVFGRRHRRAKQQRGRK
jgi:hypothetical protein